MRNEIIKLIENTLSLYDNCPEGGHGREHIIDVIKTSYNIAKELKVNKEIAVVSALFHDIGLLTHPREFHHIGSGEYIKNNKSEILNLFSENDINLIYKAVIEHRSGFDKTKYSSIYSKIVSDADRSVDINTMIKRSYQYNKEKNIYTEEEIYNQVYSHLVYKYGKGGKVKLNLPYSENKLERSREILADEKLFQLKYKEIIKYI